MAERFLQINGRTVGGSRVKTACVLRWGAIGDAIMVTPVYRLLKEEGYHVTAHVENQGKEVLKNNPYIDKVIIHEKGSTPIKDLGKYWASTCKGLRQVHKPFGEYRTGVTCPHGKKEFDLPKAERQKRYNHNYYDRTMELSGYPDKKGMNGELFFSPFEESLVRRSRKKLKNKFVILWSLSGSAHHKFYPWAEAVGKELEKKYDDIVIMTVGDGLCCMLEWEGKNMKHYSGTWGIRKSLLWTKYADLVIGTETGILNASGCFDTPKIVMLSHSTEENLSKHWKNCQVDTLNGELLPMPSDSLRTQVPARPIQVHGRHRYVCLIYTPKQLLRR